MKEYVIVLQNTIDTKVKVRTMLFSKKQAKYLLEHIGEVKENILLKDFYLHDFKITTKNFKL